MNNNNTNTIIKIGKDDPMLGVIKSLNMHLEGSAYVSKIRPTAKYGKTYLNILLEEIQFTFNNKTYELDHIWLQQVDYPVYFKNMAKIDELYSFSFTTYEYRHGERYQGQGHKRGGKESDKYGLTIDWIEPY